MASWDDIWKGLGNTGDRPQGWFGPNGKPSDQPLGDVNYYRGLQQQSDQKAQTEAFNQAQTAKTNDFLNRYKTASSSAYDTADKQFGASTLTTQANNALDRFKLIEPDTTNLTKGYTVNEAQRRQMIAQKQGEQMPYLNDMLSKAQTAQQLANQKYSADMQPYQLEAQLLDSNLGRELTGFTQDKQSQLSILLQQMQSGTQLTAQQMQQANALAIQEQQHLNALKQMKFGTDENIRQSAALKAQNAGSDNWLQQALQSFGSQQGGGITPNNEVFKGNPYVTYGGQYEYGG